MNTPQESVRTEVETILAEYTVWAGNDPTTANFKRLESRVIEVITQQREAAVREFAEKVKDFLNSEDSMLPTYTYTGPTEDFIEELLATYTKSEGGE